jgi:hypothetical protein
VRKDDHEQPDKIALPSDFTREVPGTAWKWLLQYGLPWRYWQPFVGWSEKDTRLVFTLGTPTFASTGRYMGEGKAPKWFHYGDVKRHPVLYGELESAKCVVIVEDPISAHKVGQVTLATPMLGTSVSERLVPILRHLGLPVVMWLDKDQQKFAQRRAHWLRIVTGLQVTYRFTDKDPKLLTLKQISDTIDI